MIGTDVAPVLVSANTQNRGSPRVGRTLHLRGSSSSGLFGLGGFLGFLLLLLLACEGSRMVLNVVGVAGTRDRMRRGRSGIAQVRRGEIVVCSV